MDGWQSTYDKYFESWRPTLETAHQTSAEIPTAYRHTDTHVDVDT